MKTNIILTIVLASTLSLASASIDTNLKYGQKGEEVQELQDFLAEKGLLTSTSGFFGVLTLKAVKAYQTSVSLPSTGFVGAMTRTKINKELEDLTKTSVEAEKVEPVVVVSVPQVVTATVQEATVVVPEKVYKLQARNLKYTEENGYQVSFNFEPYATLNGNKVVVDTCWTSAFGKGLTFKVTNERTYILTSSKDVRRDTENNLSGSISCVLRDGTVVSN